MEGMSERQHAAHVGLSRGAIQKAKGEAGEAGIRWMAAPPNGRLVQHADGSIDAVASDARRDDRSREATWSDSNCTATGSQAETGARHRTVCGRQISQ